MARSSSVGTRSKKSLAQREYRKALTEHRRLVDYLQAAITRLPQPECELLWEFAQISEKRCERLKRATERETRKHRSAA